MKEIFKPETLNLKLLLAVSGGMDSMVLCHLLLKKNINFVIAHCNFQLRNSESDDDEKFVKKFAKDHHIKYFIKKFDTIKYAKKNKISIQMAARELRYSWFEKIRVKNKLDYIVTAHHHNDNVETLLLNLVRGTGISGLSGMKICDRKIFRPLLFTTKKEIIKYAAENNVRFREDASNFSNKYKRNLLRNEIIPLIEKLNPDFEKTMIEIIEKLSETEKIFKWQVTEISKQLLSNKSTSLNNLLTLNTNQLKKFKNHPYLLMEVLKDFQINFSQTKDLLHSLDSISGKKIITPSHTFFKDRNNIIITPIKTEKSKNNFIINENQKEIELRDFKLKISSFKNEGYRIPKDLNIASLDMDKLEFPLLLRKWKKGDYFIPFGMKGKKKISDFLIDEKISLPQKEKIYVLLSGNKILWIVGKRIDDRFKIDKLTKNILQLNISNKNFQS